jgi:glycosyltransferase involved in cell wall biosynthesis
VTRIAHVTSGLDRHAAGVGVVVSALSGEQQSKGHEVRVFGLESPAWLEGDMDCWRGAPVEAFKVIAQPRSFGFSPGLASALESYDPEIVHLHGLWMYPARAVWNWHRRTGKPYIYSAHGMMSPVALAFSMWKKRLARHLFQDAALTRAAILHATTETEVDDFRRFGLRNRIVVVPLGIHETPVSVVPPEPYRRVLSLGRFHPQKGLDQLIKAWSQLEDQFPGWVLDLVGPGEGGHKAELEKLADRLSIQRVTFRSALHGVERDACMAGAELFVLPTRGENFALTVAESLMMETPVIATHGAPWPGLAREGCGWWIEYGVEALVSVLQEAMNLTDEQRLNLGKRGRDWMLRDYTWGAVADKMLDVYQDTIQGSHKTG